MRVAGTNPQREAREGPRCCLEQGGWEEEGRVRRLRGHELSRIPVELQTLSAGNRALLYRIQQEAEKAQF